jgi:phosphoesterase RecJ-like protein
MQSLELLQTLLQPNTKIVITHHHNPDADASGSTLALYHYLTSKGCACTVVSPNSIPAFLKWMPGIDTVKIYEDEPEIVNQLLNEAAILFCLDFNHLSRVKSFTGSIENYKGIRVLIDHHLNPSEEAFNYGVSNAAKSSTCEMVYDYICEQGDKNKITNDIAQCIYAGTMTDTGSFRFPCTTASTHSMVASLMEIGLKPAVIHQQIFDTYEENRLRFLGYVLSKNMEIEPELHTAYFAVSAEELEKFNTSSGDTEGIVNYPLSMKNIILSTFMSEKEGEVRMSFRSKGNFDVNQFSKKYFGGGGHANASGAKSTLSLKDTLIKYKLALQEQKTILQSCFNEL